MDVPVITWADQSDRAAGHPEKILAQHQGVTPLLQAQHPDGSHKQKTRRKVEEHHTDGSVKAVAEKNHVDGKIRERQEQAEPGGKNGEARENGQRQWTTRPCRSGELAVAQSRREKLLFYGVLIEQQEPPDTDKKWNSVHHDYQ